MRRFVCAACGGTYSDRGRDGYRYFHACPPLSGAELEAAGRPRSDAALSIERPGHRDERPAPSLLFDEESRLLRPESSSPRAEGRGRSEV